MAYENIKKIVSNHLRMILSIWVLLFVTIIGIFLYYRADNNKTQFMNEQILTLSEISSEITSVLYYNSQRNVANEIDYQKTLINQWITLQSRKYNTILPTATPEINYLNELGQQFYSSTNLTNTNAQITNYQNLNNQLDLLKRMGFNYINDSFSVTIFPVIPLIMIGLLLIAIVLTILLGNNLKNKLVVKNEFILEDIWNELQGLQMNGEELNESLHTPEYQEEIVETIYYPGTHKIQVLMQESKSLSNSILQSKELLLQHTNSHKEAPVSLPNNVAYPQVSEKIIFIQKLLSRLFTRAERSSTLAKATADNGFQAGILALNISIEAARSGEIGRNFMPMSDRVKDFAEKSNQIGKAILEELKDVDLSIRKAYAMSKGILEEITQFSLSEEHELTDNHSQQERTHEQQYYIQDILSQFDQMFELSQYIQNISSELETTIEVPKTTSFIPQQTTSKHSEFLKEILVRSFERLYRFNYGIDPPNNPFETISKDY